MTKQVRHTASVLKAGNTYREIKVEHMLSPQVSVSTRIKQAEIRVTNTVLFFISCFSYKVMPSRA